MAAKGTKKFPALKIQQGETAIYITFLSARDLVEGLSQVDAWSPTNKHGYQRMPVHTRFRKIARYLMGKEGHPRPILPQAVVLNVREEDKKKLRFFDSDIPGQGTLEIPADVTLWEVDGQHRLGGLRYALGEDEAYADFPIPVVITEGLARLDEAVTFHVINTTQKRVPTDLSQRFIEAKMGDEAMRLQVIAKGEDWIPKATKVVDQLVASTGNPWHGKIGIPGTKLSGIVIKQVSFVTSMKPVLTSMYGSLDPDDVGELLSRYWQAIETVFPEAFTDPNEYVIQKTVGVFPLHAIAPHVFDMVRTTNGKITKDGLIEIFKSLAHNLSKAYEGGSNFWHSKEGEAGKYAGAKGFRILTEILKEHLPEMKKLKVV